MKKLFLVLSFLFALATFATAQELGIRFGDSAGGNNVAVDGIIGLGSFSRIHGDVTFGGNGVGIDAIWNFIYRPLGGEAFHWYVGAGPFTYLSSDFALGVAGEIGLEYTFNGAPISISADWRPYFRIVEDTNFWAGGFGLNVRYVFNQ